MAKTQVSRPGHSGTTDDAKPAPAPPEVAESGDAPRKQVERMIQHRGRSFKVIRTTRNRRTGAIYDYFEYDRPVKDRITGKSSSVLITKKLRRPGTGVVVQKEEEYNEEEL